MDNINKKQALDPSDINPYNTFFIPQPKTEIIKELNSLENGISKSCNSLSISIDYLIEILKQHGTDIINLNLVGDRLFTTDDLIQIITSCPNLEKLFLSGCELKNEILRAIMPYLRQLNHLRGLYFAENHLSQAFKYIVDLPHLEELDLSLNEIDKYQNNQSEDTVWPTGLPNLKTLTLSYNGINDKLVRQIASNLPPDFKTLKIAGRAIQEQQSLKSKLQERGITINF